MDLSNVEYNVRRQIALVRLRPTVRSRILDVIDVWRQAFSFRPIVGAAVTAVAIVLGSAGGFAIAAPAVDRLSDQTKITFATEINPILQARQSQ